MKKTIDLKLHRIFAVILAIFIIAGSLPLTASAAGVIDLSVRGSLKLKYQYQYELIDGVNVRIYNVADIDDNGNYTLRKPYSDITSFPVTGMHEVDVQSEWDDMIKSIEAYIYTNNIEPTASVKTDAEGNAFFESLDLGLYLVISDSLKKGYCTYTFSSFFISVPSKDENGDWKNVGYDVVAVPKCERIDEQKVEEIDYNLYKRWDDAGNESKRPKSIEISIYRDGIIYEKVTLSAENNWHYAWKSEPGHSWTMAETELTGYTMKLVAGDNSFTLTNTYKEDNPPPDKPNEPDNPKNPDKPKKPEKPDKPKKHKTPKTPDNPSKPTVAERILSPISEVLGQLFGPESDVLGERKLPQTGQLWWPVFFLSILGGLSFIYGFIVDRLNRDR